MSNIENQLNKMLKSNAKISNTQGINLAYDSPNKVYIKDDKMYIAGTSSSSDWIDNFTKLKFGKIREMERYKQAKELLEQNPQVKTLVGHSMGGSVVLALAKDYPDRDMATYTYDAPVFSLGFDQPTERHKRFRSAGDLISAFDGSSISYNTDSLNPLSNHNINRLNNIDETIPPLTLP